MAYIRCGGGTRNLERVTLLTITDDMGTSGELSQDFDEFQYIGVKYVKNPTSPTPTYYETVMPAAIFAQTAFDQSDLEHPMFLLGGADMGATYANMFALEHEGNKRAVMWGAGAWKTYQNTSSSIPTTLAIFVPVEVYGLR